MKEYGFLNNLFERLRVSILIGDKMSTDYVASKSIPLLAIYNFNYNSVKIDTINEDGSAILTDGKNYLWVCTDSEIHTASVNNIKKQVTLEYSHDYNGVIFTRYGYNNPGKIIEALEVFFNVRLYSEHEEQFEEIAGNQDAD